MASANLLRLAARQSSSALYRSSYRPLTRTPALASPSQFLLNRSPFSSCAVRRSGHEDETFEEFSARYVGLESSVFQVPSTKSVKSQDEQQLQLGQSS